jgi:long-subunit acyl-CoA synthetase (AMP-forming)
MGYGMTEVSLVFVSMPEDKFEKTAETVGFVVDHTEVSDEVT